MRVGVRAPNSAGERNKDKDTEVVVKLGTLKVNYQASKKERSLELQGIAEQVEFPHGSSAVVATTRRTTRKTRASNHGRERYLRYQGMQGPTSVGWRPIKMEDMELQDERLHQWCEQEAIANDAGC